MDSNSPDGPNPPDSDIAPDLFVSKEPAKRRNWLVSALIALLVVLLLGSGMAYAAHLGPFAPRAAAPATTTPADLASLPCNAGPVARQLTDTAPAPTAAEFAKTQHTYASAPAMSIDIHKHYCVGLNTNRGLIVLDLDPSMAPNTVNNFVYLARHHFYDGMPFHRVIPGFIIQAGDPSGNGRGGPGYTFDDEPVKGDYTPGCVAMANAGPNTNGSQFFICTADDSAQLAKVYNLFGHVVLGMNIALKIQGPGDDFASQNIVPDRIKHVTIVAVNAASDTTVAPTATPTANPLANTCFLDPSGPGVPAVYQGNATPTSGPATAPKLKGAPVTLQDGLQYVDIKKGTGPVVVSGSQVTANYTGWLASTCQKFDSSYDAHNGQPAQPFTFQIGEGAVIKGWEEGLLGMKPGGIRRLYIPAALAYGEQGAGPIPPNADLIFDVQVIAVQ